MKLKVVLLWLGVAGLAAFVLVAADVELHGLLAQRDAGFDDWLAASAPALVSPARLVGDVASTYVMIGLLVVAGALLWRRGEKREAVRLPLVAFAGAALVFVLKHVFARARPVQAAGIETDFGFPSGHATLVAILGMELAWLALRKRSRGAPLLVGLGVAWALFIAASRLVAGVHYPTDVLAGLALGCAVSGLAIGLSR